MSELNWIKHNGGPMPVPGDTIVRVNASPDMARARREERLPFQEYGKSDTAEFWNSVGRSWWEGGGGQITEYAIVGTLGEPEYADTVNSPAHYTSGDIECIDAIKAQMSADEFAGYLRGNVVKYMWRYRDKGGVESLEKARWYLERLIGELRA